MKKTLLLCYVLLSTGLTFGQNATDDSNVFRGTIYYKTSISGNGIDYKQANRQAQKEYVLKYGDGFIRHEESGEEGIYTLYDLRSGEAYSVNKNDKTYALLKGGAGTFMDMDSTYIKDISKTDTIMNYHCVRFKSESKRGKYNVTNLYWVTPELQINPAVYDEIDPRLVNYQYNDKLRNKGIMLKTVTRYKHKRKTIYSTRLYVDKIDETPVDKKQFTYPDELGYAQKRKVK